MPTIEQKEVHRQIRAQVRGAVEANQTQCDHFGTPVLDCYSLYNAGVEKPCFDACYRIFLDKSIRTLEPKRGSK